MNLVRSLDGIHIPTSAYIAGQVSPDAIPWSDRNAMTAEKCNEAA